MKTEHATLLNALDDMASNPMYALRRGLIRQAEMLILSQEERIKDLEEALRHNLACSIRCVEDWAGCSYTFDDVTMDIGDNIRDTLQLGELRG